MGSLQKIQKIVSIIPLSIPALVQCLSSHSILANGSGIKNGITKLRITSQYDVVRRMTDENNPLLWQKVGGDIDGENLNDHSGFSVDISANGKRVVIGAPDANRSTGQTKIYEEIVNGEWFQVGDSIDGESISDTSGESVAISDDGKRVIIGADGNGDRAGHAQVFEEVNGIWKKVGNDIDGENIGDRSGRSVGMSSDGKRIIIGATKNGGNQYLSGHARIFEEKDGEWLQIGDDIDGKTDREKFGASVSMNMDGKRVIISNKAHGEVRVYEERNNAWFQVGADILGDEDDDGSGESVEISADGKRIVIGAPANDNNGYNSGNARIFEETNGEWNQVGDNIDGEGTGDYFGTSVDMSSDGKRVIVGAMMNDGNNWFSSGHARVFEEINRVWVQLGGDIDGEMEGAKSGCSVGINSDGTRLIVGAYMNDGKKETAGHARVFELDPLPIASPTSAPVSPAVQVEDMPDSPKRSGVIIYASIAAVIVVMIAIFVYYKHKREAKSTRHRIREATNSYLTEEGRNSLSP